MTAYERPRNSGAVTPNTAFERPWDVVGPRLAAAEPSWLAAQLGRKAAKGDWEW